MNEKVKKFYYIQVENFPELKLFKEFCKNYGYSYNFVIKKLVTKFIELNAEKKMEFLTGGIKNEERKIKRKK